MGGCISSVFCYPPKASEHPSIGIGTPLKTIVNRLAKAQAEYNAHVTLQNAKAQSQCFHGKRSDLKCYFVE